ncbi:ferric enterobactin receptor [Aeromonas sp. RU39B]|uniref:FepA family TonB-dependent siderophore receptor n=1 Tax=Aeromonas sp. RU39B TaxID=1907416 RepID=UPI000957029E|nr:FepA family TonB-dependent siderophore receptor [Aeromonas sp. RU39B]SIQ49282.1 ferric enterobactin receptor [Aeromonas sp. RU39B]
MHSSGPFQLRPLTVLIGTLLAFQAGAADSTTSSQTSQEEEATSQSTVLVTAKAEELLKQQPGVSVITAKDLSKDPPVNDASDIIRKMPGVNLTGNSASGARGNNRQIDIRGMGPENTLILIDGIPTTSRNSVRYDRTGERDTRGDSNWVPVEEIESIEVLRGPAAAMYGSGAQGGVVNIITKQPTDKWKGSADLYTNQPGRSAEGATRRANFSVSGPLIDDTLSMRLYGNINKTEADSPNINDSAVSSGTTAAGREGVRNKDANLLLSWKIDPAQKLDFKTGFSRQGNIYAGDTSLSSASTTTQTLANSGAETNRMYRFDTSLNHTGNWSWGDTQNTLSWTNTRNNRMDEGLTGGINGQITSAESYTTSTLNDYRASTKADIPVMLGVDQTLTTGMDWTYSKLDDPFSTSQVLSSKTYGSGSTSYSLGDDRASQSSQGDVGVFVQDSIQATGTTVVIPGVRVDQNSDFGSNLTWSLNASQELGEMFTAKAGVARVFKAPNLYQVNPNYLLLSSGNGCPIGTSVGCYLVGNDDLEAEHSINSELGLQFKHNGWVSGVTYFQNDYDNKIVAGESLLGTYSGWNVYRWENSGPAIIRGFEGNLTVPLATSLSWTTNGTYMIENKSKETGNPLSVIPKYTINTMLDWQVTDKWSLNTTYTFYGRQKPRTSAENRKESSGLDTSEIGSYGLLGFGTQYQLTKTVRVGTGVSNVFDKVILRSSEGANTYNQPGVAWNANLHVDF